MHIHDVYQTTLCYLPIGGRLVMQQIPFKTEGHLISVELQTYAEELLEYGYTNKEVGELTGLGKNTVKQIGLARLQRKYTENGVGEKLQKPEKQARLLSIDEFKLHNGHRYAAHIIDLETGHILLMAHGKKKQVVCDFIEHVAWMDGRSRGCRLWLNSYFEEAFEELCPHIQPVFDYFHIVKNFNEKVVSGVRKDE